MQEIDETPLFALDTLEIMAQSKGWMGGEFCVVCIDGEYIMPKENESGHHRGMQVVIFDPTSRGVALA